MGFSMTTHYCGGQAVKSKLVLGDTSLDCGMEKKADSCETASGTSINRSCCENHFMSLGVEDDYQESIVPSQIKVNFIFTFVFTYFEFYTSYLQQEVAYGDYSPPFRNRDVLVMFQTFLI